MTAAVEKVLIIGLGLIGGSLALALKKSGFASQVWAHGHREPSLQRGLELGVIDAYSLDLDTALAGADIVVIGTPTLTANEMMQTIVSRLPATAVITDVASVKGSLVSSYQRARDALAMGAEACAAFVPGHPIAGSERSGVEAANAQLFVDHRVILTPLPDQQDAALQLIRAMWQCTGAEVVELGVAEHDAILAATSHLPHVLAYTLVDSLARSELSADIFRFAAGGFRDFTRIASSDPVMWRDIALANRQELLNAIDSFSDHLGLLREAVASGDAQALHDTFAAAKSARDAFVGKQENS